MKFCVTPLSGIIEQDSHPLGRFSSRRLGRALAFPLSGKSSQTLVERELTPVSGQVLVSVVLEIIPNSKPCERRRTNNGAPLYVP